MKETIFDLSIFLVIMSFVIIQLLVIPMYGGDEFIVYYNTYKIFNGEMIYRDVNILTTPLLFYIALFIFKVFGSKFIIFRIYNILINIILILTIYKIFTNLKIGKKKKIIYTLILEILILKKVAILGATYNILGLMLCLIGLNLMLKRELIKNYYIKQGIIIFLILMAKQNVGLYYILANILIEICIKNRKRICSILKLISVPSILSVCYIIYLYINNNLDNFISYTILGLKEFSQNIYITGTFWIGLDIIIICSIVFILSKKIYKKEQKNIIITLFITGICMLPIGYPIADDWHMIVSSTILIISAIYTFDKNIDINIKEKVLNCIIALILCYMIFYNVVYIKIYLNNYIKDSNNIFHLLTISNDKRNKINIMEEFISKSDKKVIIVSPEAGQYYINVGIKSNGIFDLPFKGNLRREGEYSLINKTQQYDDAYMLLHSKKTYWQESDVFRKYIEDNYKSVGTIEDFTIYCIKN